MNESNEKKKKITTKNERANIMMLMIEFIKWQLVIGIECMYGCSVEQEQKW